MVSKLYKRRIEPENYKLYDENDFNSSYIYGEVNENDVIDVLESINNENINSFIDIGSGRGKLVLEISQHYRDIFCTGIEIQSHRYENSMEYLLQCNEIIQNTTEFICDNFNNIYLGNYDMIYCCNVIFSKNDNQKLYNKLLSEAKGFVLLFDYDHSLKPYWLETYHIRSSWQKDVHMHLFKI